MYIVKQQQEYCLIRTICVITRKGPRTKLLMEISLVFNNIVINCSKALRQAFLTLLHTSMDQFLQLMLYYKSYTIT